MDKAVPIVIGLFLLVALFSTIRNNNPGPNEARSSHSRSYSPTPSEPPSRPFSEKSGPRVREPEWKRAVSEVSSFVQKLPEQRLQEEHQKIAVTEDSYKMHKKTARFSIGLSREVELEAMEQQRLHIVQLCDRIIATFNQLDRVYTAAEQVIRDVSWDSSAERKNQFARLDAYKELRKKYLEPALLIKQQYVQ